jgi:hypothetical protein
LLEVFLWLVDSVTTWLSWWTTSTRCVCSFHVRRKEAVELFFSLVWVHFIFPNSIISNQDNKFLGIFWISLWDRMDTNIRYSTTLPQNDGWMEVINWTLVQLLLGYNRKHQNTWDEQLAYIWHSYNKSLHSSTNKSPFETYFGYLPPSSFGIVYGQ